MSSGYDSWLARISYAISRADPNQGIFSKMYDSLSGTVSSGIQNISNIALFIPKIVVQNVTTGNLTDSINNKKVIETAISNYSLMKNSCFYIHLFKAMEKFYGQSFDSDINITGSTSNIPDIFYINKSYSQQRYNIQLYQLYQLLLIGDDIGIPCYDIICKFGHNETNHKFLRAVDILLNNYTPESFEVVGDGLIQLVNDFLSATTLVAVQLLEYLSTQTQLRNATSITPDELKVINRVLSFYTEETNKTMYLIHTKKEITKNSIKNLFGLTSGAIEVPLAELLQDQMNDTIDVPIKNNKSLELARKHLVELYTPYSKEKTAKTESSSNSWVSWATKSTFVRSIFKTADIVAGLDLKKYATFEAFVASYGKHLRDIGADRAIPVFVPIGSLLNYHPPDLDSHFSGPAATMSRKKKEEYFKIRRSELYSGMIQHANSELKQSKVPLTYKTVKKALKNGDSFYIEHPTKTTEVVLYLTDSFFQSVAPTMGSASKKPVESLSVYLKKPVDKETFIHFSQYDKASMKSYEYSIIEEADFHLVLDGQNRLQIIKQVLSELVENNFKIANKKINQVYVETLSYIQIPNKLCDTAFKIRNRSLKCDWFDNFPQSNVSGSLNRDQSRVRHIKRSEIKTCGAVDDDTRPFDEMTDEVADTFNTCVHREINTEEDSEDSD